jgi:phage regulator Rha-like protein
MQLATIENQTTMSSREIAELTEKRHDHVLADTRKMLEELGLRSTDFSVDLPDSYGRLQPAFNLPKRECLILVSGYSMELRARIIDRWQELEAQAVKPMSVLPQTYIEALEQLLIAKRAEQLAIETKAEIGHRREATAMNTASQAVKKATKLEIELDKAKEYATVKRMEMQYHGQKFNWRLLKETSQLLEIPSVTVFDANYGTVRAYHAVVWQEAYALDIL